MTDVRKYLREWAMPTVLCPGCAHGTVLHAFLDAVDEMQLDTDKLAMVAGIGCSSRLIGYVDMCTLHTTHGRAPAFATGLKLARPDLEVVVITGDGDGLAIGGNHLIHAARRNIDMTVLLFNNGIYGMTGGQVAPTTALGAKGTTAPFGSSEAPFDPCKLMTGAGASFVARALASKPQVLKSVIVEAVTHTGFSFVEVMTTCPTYYGRYNGIGGGSEMLAWLNRQDDSVAIALADKRSVDHISIPPIMTGLPTGVLHREERRVFTGRVSA